jgi:omega-amidase
MKIKISLAQMDIKVGQMAANYNHALELVQEASEKKCDMIILPELWAYGYDLPQARRYAYSMSRGIFQQISELAQKHSIYIGGSLLEKRAGKIYNTFTIHSPDGELAGVYRKIHLFKLMEEDQWLSPGNKPVIASLPWGLSGMEICYDLRFPELSRLLALKGVCLILIPAEWPIQRIEHWRALIRARAIENQIFVAAVNRVGVEAGTQFGGCSMVVNPNGDVLVEGGTEEALLITEIDFDEIDKSRKKMYSMADRRPSVYK